MVQQHEGNIFEKLTWKNAGSQPVWRPHLGQRGLILTHCGMATPSSLCGILPHWPNKMSKTWLGTGENQKGQWFSIIILVSAKFGLFGSTQFSHQCCGILPLSKRPISLKGQSNNENYSNMKRAPSKHSMRDFILKCLLLVQATVKGYVKALSETLGSVLPSCFASESGCGFWVLGSEGEEDDLVASATERFRGVLEGEALTGGTPRMVDGLQLPRVPRLRHIRRKSELSVQLNIHYLYAQLCVWTSASCSGSILGHPC